MTNFVVSNNASTTLAAAASSSATTLTLASSTNFPSSIPAGTVLAITLNDAATRQVYEVCYATAISGTSVTVIRGQEGTAAQNWAIGDYVFVGVTAGLLQGLGYGNGQTYANDSGSANAYVVTLTPALTTRIIGVPIKVKITNSNTGGSTLNYGPGAVSVVHTDGSSLVSGDLLAGMIATFIDDGTHIQLAATAYSSSVWPLIQATGVAALLSTAGTSLTLTATEVGVGVALGGRSYKLGNFSQTFNGAITGSGGMDTGTLPTSGFVAIYAIYNPTSATVSTLGCNATTSSGQIYTGANMPSGFTASCLLTILPTNATPAIVAVQAIGRDVILFSLVTVLTNGTATTATNVSLSSAIPAAAVYIAVQISVLNSTSITSNSLGIIGPSSARLMIQITAQNVGATDVQSFIRCPIQTAQQITYKVGETATPLSIFVQGYSF